jgi:hypothetical protein
MQLPDNTRTRDVSGPYRKRRRICLLLVGSQSAFKNADVARVFGGPRFEIVARSSTLAEALACLAPGTIDLVLLSSEFPESELELFAIEARRRRYDGLILHSLDTRERMADPNAQELGPIKAGDLVVDVSSHRAWMHGTEIRCNSLEFELLKFLSRHPNESLSHKSLLEALWGDPTAQRHSLRELIRSVRAKIETTRPPRYIVTQHQFGYRFVPSPRPIH